MEDNDKGKAKAWRDAIVKLIHPDMGDFILNAFLK